MAKKELIFIHGGESFSSYEAFITHLKTRELRNVLEDPPQRFKHTLRTELSDIYDVYLPSMPNSDNARYEEWKIWFERHLSLTHDGVVLVGHSQGGWFLVKYLIENVPQVTVGALILIGTPAYSDDFGGEDGGDFQFDVTQLPTLSTRVKTIVLVYSMDDPVVGIKHFEVYRQALAGAQVMKFIDRGHFLTATFPELIQKLRELS